MVTVSRTLALAAVGVAAATALAEASYGWSNRTHAALDYHAPARRLALSCALQTGVDFAGNDIASVSASQASDCCAKCAAYANCAAFTWTDFQGGTCWLKSGRGTAKAAAGATSAVVSSIGATCSVQDNVDIVGNDLSNTPGKAPADCCTKCAATSGCGAYTWSDYQGGTCWLKTSQGTTKTTAGVSSGVVVPATCSAEVGVDYVGNDLSSVAGQAASCCATCAATSRCQAYTWSDYQGGTCWLKTAKGATKNTPGVQSGEIGGVTPPTPTTAPPPATTTPAPPPVTTTPAPPPVTTTPRPSDPSCKIEYNVDYAGNDIGSVAGADATACCSKCLDAPGCNAFTWSGYNGGTCYLKSGKGTSTSSSGVHSAVVTRPPPTNSCKIQENTDFYGLDIASVQRPSAGDCCDVCASYSGCGAFTWSDFNGGTCWLKSAAGQASYKQGSHSAVVTVANPPKTHIQYRMRTGEVPLRSVNLGGWLVGEYWMSYQSPAWKNAWDYAYRGEMYVMRQRGHANADALFEEHRRTWITEDDIREIASQGLNAVRVPVGYWIVADDPTTWKNDDMRTFAPGGLKYLDKLINEWAVKYNLAVMISLHAHQGSQNGHDHSSPPNLGAIQWGFPESVENSLQLVTFLAARYKLSPAFLGMNLMNEPAEGINLQKLIDYYYEAYRRVRATGNDCILVTSPLLQRQGPGEMTDLMRWPAYNNVWHEFHLYFKWGIYENMNEWQVMDEARKYRSTHLDPWPGNYMYMGEWALCSPEKNGKFADLNLLRQFAAIQLEQFKGAHSGWAFWSWKHGDEGTLLSRGWSLREMIRLGVVNFK